MNVGMKIKLNTIILALIAIMVLVAFLVGSWFAKMNPEGLTLNSPLEDNSGESVSAFGFGASIGLLLSSLFYCVLAAGILISSKLKNKPAGSLPIAIAVLAAVGFSLSYVVDGYFLN